MPCFSIMDNEEKFLPYIWVYNSDYSMENSFKNNGSNNNVIIQNAPISPPTEETKLKIFS